MLISVMALIYFYKVKLYLPSGPILEFSEFQSEIKALAITISRIK